MMRQDQQAGITFLIVVNAPGRKLEHLRLQSSALHL
jgi:hypothetical protein